MEVGMLSERGAEPVDEGHRACPCIRPRAGAVRAQMLLDGIEEGVRPFFYDVSNLGFPASYQVR